MINPEKNQVWVHKFDNSRATIVKTKQVSEKEGLCVVYLKEGTKAPITQPIQLFRNLYKHIEEE